MSALSANCPSCGAPISFKSGASIVLVCDYCRSVVARTDRALEDLGRVAELVETGSPLDVGLRGTWRGVPFELTGRAQLGHAAGGVWDEWYATFSNGWLGWLAEAQGRFYLTFRQQPPQPDMIPPFEQLHLGHRVAGIPSATPLVVAEKGEARALGARGEIPYLLVPGETFFYADLSGRNGAFGTIDYSQRPPLVFTGNQVTLEELGIAGSARAPEREARRVGAATLNCPNCGGPLELRAPDKTERVTCPNCNSLLDVNQGKLQFFKALRPGKVEPYIALGSVGEFGGVKFTIIGFMQRSVEVEGVRYFWTEYLLYNPQAGFRWLVHSDDHWSFVEAVPPGEVFEGPGKAYFRGKTFKIFQDALARVEYVSGEFYWKVEAGEQAAAIDYVRPPEMLSKEVSRTVTGKGKHKQVETGEINWSLGRYLTVKEVEKIFNLANLPRPRNVAPNQPFRHTGIYKYWGILLLALFTVAFLSTITGGSNAVMTRSFEFPALPNAEGTQVVFSDQFELQGRRNIRVNAQSPVDNSWIYIAGDLVNDETGLVQTFELPIEYYYGVEDGESWSEGGQSRATYLSSLPPGKYTLRLEAQWEKWQQPQSVTVNISQGEVTGFNAFMSLVVLSIPPILVLVWHWRFHQRRWSESMFGGSSDSGSDDDE